MSHEAVVEIANAKSHIEKVEEIDATFIETVRSHPAPNDIPSKVEIDGRTLRVACFGWEAYARPRTVVRDDSSFAIEYIFFVDYAGTAYEVWRFYVMPGGLLTAGIEDKASICDFNSHYVAHHICKNVCSGVLRSPVLEPSEPNQRLTRRST